MYTRYLKAGLAAGVVFLAACGGDGGDGGNGPNGTELSADERQALASALGANAALGGDAGMFAGAIYGQLTEYGTMSATTSANVAAQLAKGMSASLASRAGSYDAFGMQFKYTVSYQGESYSGVVTGVYGWAGLDPDAETVDELIYVLHASQGDFDNSFSADITGDDWEAESYTAGAYYSRSGGAYAATEGEFNLTGASFGGSDDCSIDQGGVEIDCEVSTGSMRGNFNFTAEGSEGSTSHSIPSFDLPALRMEFSMDASDFEAMKARR